jgi:hypothetical protein
MGGSPCSGEVNSSLCGWFLQLGALVRWKKGNKALLTGFSDTDFAEDVDARKSTTGVIFFLVSNPIT